MRPSTVVVRPLIGVNSPVMVNGAAVVKGTVWRDEVAELDIAAAEIAPLGVISWGTVKLVTVPTVTDTSAVGATVVAKFATIVVWLGPVVSVRR